LNTADNPDPVSRPLRVFWRVLSAAPGRGLALLLLLMAIGSVLESVGLVLLVPMLESLDNNGAPSGNAAIRSLQSLLADLGLSFSLEGLLSVFCVLVIARGLIAVVRVRQSTRLQNTLVDGVRRRCYHALLHANWRWLVTGRRSDHASALMNEVDQLGNGLFFGIQLLATAVTMVAYLTAAFALSWQACLVSIGAGVVIFVLLKGLRRQAMQLGQRMSEAERGMMGNVQESLAGVKLAKILGAESDYLRRFDQHLQSMREEDIGFQINQTRASSLYQTIGALLLAGFLYLGITVLMIPMATLLTLVFIFSRLLPMFANTQQQYQYWLHAMPSVERCYQLIEQAEAAAEPALPTDAGFDRIQEAITLDAVSVRYNGREASALAGVTLRFPARTTTAITGESGAGKSTLADVLMGLLEPDSGTMQIDGRRISGEDLMRWRASVAYVPQDAFLFHDSIRNNLLWGKADADDEALRQALQRSAAEFVFALPQGLDTIVGDGGILLSGGERQRLALARALLKKPALLILDEATSALDRNNEARIRQAIENLHGDLTVIIIGHRLATLEHADHIVVLAHGSVKAQGAWQEIAAHL